MPSYEERRDPHAGTMLARARKASGITQGELAALLGVTLADVRLWELGREPIPAKHHAEIASLFGFERELLDRPTRREITMQERTLLHRYHRAPKELRKAVQRILAISDEAEAA